MIYTYKHGTLHISLNDKYIIFNYRKTNKESFNELYVGQIEKICINKIEKPIISIYNFIYTKKICVFVYINNIWIELNLIE